ncbi:zinc-finger domain-containing protein [Snodgrassella alvi]|uniref:zinc-finger domain-containing protein n=1 Tax=Snodgrassella alvi TaxID=1196083 RepID=UPI003CFEF47D
MSNTAQSVTTITPHDLPLICTGPEHETWNGHPRVFLPIKSNSSIECPYCGKQYHLDGIADNHH